MNRIALRALYEQGRIEKHAYAEWMSEQHAVLTEYASLLVDTAIDAIRIEESGVCLRARDSGLWFWSDPTDRGIPTMVSLNFRGYEQAELAALIALADPEAAIVDAGANIGWVSVHLAAAHPNARVVAFEPIPSNHGYLAANVALNELENVETHPIGLWHTSEVRALSAPAGILGASAVWHDGADGERVECRLEPLDAVWTEDHGRLGLLKADVEGAELSVVRGAWSTIQRDRPVLFLEMLRKHARRFDYHPNELIERLADLGYACFAVDDLGLRSFPHMSETATETNFLFLHPDVHPDPDSLDLPQSHT